MTLDTAAGWAAAQVGRVRDDPRARMALLARTHRQLSGPARRYASFRRAALSFMRWHAARGVLCPPGDARPGSPWWRAVNERLLRDGCEAWARSTGLGGQALYDWSAGEIGHPGLRELARDGSPVCAWSYADRQYWTLRRETQPLRVMQRVTRAG